MAIMSGIPDLPGTYQFIGFGSPTGAVRLLRKHPIIGAAGDNGAVNLWRDRHRRLRGERHVHQRVVEERTFKNLTELREWTKAALERIR